MTVSSSKYCFSTSGSIIQTGLCWSFNHHPPQRFSIFYLADYLTVLSVTV